MKFKFPLAAKILLWLFLNLVFLALVFYVFLRAQFHLGLDSLLMGPAGDRIQATAGDIAFDLNGKPRADWDAVLKQWSDSRHVQFVLFRNDGPQVAGEKVSLPAEVGFKLAQGRGQLGPGPEGRGWGGGPPPGGEGGQEPPFDPLAVSPREGRGFGPGNGGAPPGAPRVFMLRAGNPARYWVGVRIRVGGGERDTGGPPGPPLTLLAVSDSIRGSGLFFDYVPWVAVGFGCVLVSVLFWLPLVRGITRSVSNITRATEQIAEGRFEARVAEARRDELGRLGLAINQMSARLAGFVTGQKRFLGDIAHELCSPIARIQMALGILEQRAGEKQANYVQDLREEVQEMSSLVSELLSFSKASLEPAAVKLQTVQLRPVARKAAHREGVDGVEVKIDMDDSVRVLADPELLLRSLANLIRNAVRYAGQAGPITVSARREGGDVLITVSDQGPGVPEASLAQLFDPFYRTEPSRTRETGGVGLGLAIVKTCVESCQGAVTCRNLQPTGLEVTIRLRGA